MMNYKYIDIEFKFDNMKGYVDFYPSEQVAKALNQIKLLTFKGSQSDNIDTVKLTLMQIRDYVTNLTMDTKDERN